MQAARAARRKPQPAYSRSESQRPVAALRDLLLPGAPLPVPVDSASATPRKRCRKSLPETLLAAARSPPDSSPLPQPLADTMRDHSAPPPDRPQPTPESADSIPVQLLEQSTDAVPAPVPLPPMRHAPA